MELKPAYHMGDRSHDIPFNRTSMELKLIYICIAATVCSFNRTSMELKLPRRVIERLDRELLIEPVWN